ncbi:hypothetical protein [Clostridium sp. C2-6-12]|uniref:hypothetical protein n=1 Tax=Clostridium sp. C2-6-12 TaxID=2698832 RepID=UPI00136904A1|nr:hypothetical protein [Clostridium sp. C2-6-12]
MDSVMKELELAYKEVSSFTNTADRDFRLEVLDKIEEFILEYDWGTSKNIKEFKRFCKLSNKEFARLTKQSENNVRLIHKRMSDRIREKIGYNKIYTAVNGSREEVLRLLNCINILKSNIMSDYYIPSCILTKVSEHRCSVEYLVSDLSSEIYFLKKHSKQRINREINELDKDKLSYVFKVLNSNEGYLLDKKEAILNKLLNDKEVSK